MVRLPVSPMNIFLAFLRIAEYIVVEELDEHSERRERYHRIDRLADEQERHAVDYERGS